MMPQINRIAAIRAAFEAAGVEFIYENGGGSGRADEQARPRQYSLTREQAKTAREMLRWNRERLGREAGISPATIGMFERIGRMPSPQKGAEQADRVERLRKALEAAGVEFIEQCGSGPGVRLRSSA